MTVFYPAGAGLGALSALFAVVACLLILFAYRSTLGLLIGLLARMFNSVDINIPLIGGHPFGFIAEALHDLDNTILKALGTAVNASEYAWHFYLHAFTSSLNWIGEAVAYDMNEVTKAFSRLVNSTIPRLTAASVALATHPLRFAQAQLGRDLAAAEATIRGDVSAVERAAQLTERVALARIARLENEAKLAGAAAVATTLPLIHGLERETTSLEKWVKTHTKDLTVAGAVGLVLAVVAREFPWLRCNNSRSMMKHLCSWPVKVFEDFLAGVLDYLVVTNLCFLMSEMDKLAVALLPLIEAGSAELDKLVACRGATAAADIPLKYHSEITPWVILPA